jgi:DNA repair exonuclease SbcCD nuclease subunit
MASIKEEFFDDPRDLPKKRNMPNMRKKVALVTVSDLHLSHEAPRSRAEKGEEWYGVMKNYLLQLRKIASDHEAPVVYAGDIFNTWREPSGLVNFAIDYLPPGYAIPGQHDLPYHLYEDLDKSPYQTLCHAQVIMNLRPGKPEVVSSNLMLHGFPWGEEVQPPIKKHKGARHVAVIHAYCWSPGNSYPNAPKPAAAGNWYARLHGYDVAVVGDNHKGFVWESVPPTLRILNNGSFIRRNSDEKDYQPCVGLVYSDGTVERVPLDCSKDKWADLPEEPKPRNDSEILMKEFTDFLKEKGRTRIDFTEALIRSLDLPTLGSAAKKMILEALEAAK